MSGPAEWAEWWVESGWWARFGSLFVISFIVSFIREYIRTGKEN